MLSPGAYLLGILELALVIGPLVYAAWRLRASFLGNWVGAPARLVETITVVGLLTVLSELLGLAGLFKDLPLILGALLIAAGASRVRRPEGETVAAPECPPVPAIGLFVTLGVVAILFAHWGIEAKLNLDGGMTNFDSLWYHMPFAADMAQSGSTTGLHYTDTVFLNWLYPQNSELLHAVGIILTGRDTTSLFINFLWLAVALLAAWCIGRPYGRGHLTVAAVGVVLEAHTLVVREPGDAKNDVAAAALLLAAIAILITARSAWRAQNDAKGESPQGGAFAVTEGGVTGWPLAAAGLSAGLAAGTKVTVLAGIGALTVATIVLAPAGRRRIAAAWWFIPLFAGGAFWYVRNLVVSANPIPQVRTFGPIGLPGPDRLQTGRPDFTVVHYATDTRVWNDYFFPALHEEFGRLWPIMLLAAIVGAVWAIVKGRDRVIRWSGVVALVALVAYTATPLSAAGLDGAPVAFGINVRFAVPALLAGLVLLPLARPFDVRRRQWVLLAFFVVLMVATNRADAVVRSPGRGFGILVAVVAVLLPAAIFLARSRGAARGVVLGAAAALGIAIVAIGYPVQRHYLQDRFVTYDYTDDLTPAYRWANDISDSRIGLAGTTSGFLEYGFYGRDLSNRVRYLGLKAPKGGYDAIPTCTQFRQAVNDADLDYLVTSPFLNFVNPGDPIPSPEAGWLKGEGAVAPILRTGKVTVWRVKGQLDPTACGPLNAPLRSVPDQPGA